jgi:holo-[acyl-carrier protein] synthase
VSASDHVVARSLRVGIDIVSIARVRAVFGKRSASRLSQVFAAEEIADCRRRADFFESLAGRFAAKESFMKAIGPSARPIRPADVVVAADGAGCPRLEVRGGAAQAMRALGVATVAVSVAHERAYAVACVVLVP